jgi:hypothetical protein
MEHRLAGREEMKQKDQKIRKFEARSEQAIAALRQGSPSPTIFLIFLIFQ